ncbi:MAG: sodium-dependent transporter [Candidatus Marinimicrobia bacterium CG08_land_8_20_14_0_20_45_22]|nr:MAG: sodium-dependent transporter [Candidatus Marinimicrobia bacterium CG08_land_8_20_14_0_20_45_22]
MNNQREQWGSRIGFILSATGSAIGLGNIWRFPYLVGENGGAAFIFVYLICVFVIGLSLVITEMIIGRTGQKNPVGSFRALSGGNPFWIGVGLLGVITGFLILSYYNVIAGWSLGYVIESIKGSFQSLGKPEEAGILFQQFSSSTIWSVVYSAIFMSLTVVVIYFGVTKGIELASKWMLPLLFFLLIVLVIRGITIDGAKAGILYLVKPNFSLITPRVVLVALGQAFYSLSLGMGALLTYGSYLSKKENIPVCAISMVTLDVIVSLLSGFMIFPALFAMGLQPGQGIALLFNILPILFNTIPGGYFFRIIFFILICLAALTSTISLLEVIVSFFVDEFNLKRKNVAIAVGSFVFLLGIPSALSFGAWKDFQFFHRTVFELADFISSNVFLPVGGICMALFVGWFWGKDKVLSYVHEGSEGFKGWIVLIWMFIVRFVTPIMILLVFLLLIGIL